MKYDHKGVTFNSVKTPQMLFKQGPIGIVSNNEETQGMSYNNDRVTKVNPFINAVDIDWNGAELSENIVLNSTSDLINVLKGLLAGNNEPIIIPDDKNENSGTLTEIILSYWVGRISKTLRVNSLSDSIPNIELEVTPGYLNSIEIKGTDLSDGDFTFGKLSSRGTSTSLKIFIKKIPDNSSTSLATSISNISSPSLAISNISSPSLATSISNISNNSYPLYYKQKVIAVIYFFNPELNEEQLSILNDFRISSVNNVNKTLILHILPSNLYTYIDTYDANSNLQQGASYLAIKEVTLSYRETSIPRMPIKIPGNELIYKSNVINLSGLLETDLTIEIENITYIRVLQNILIIFLDTRYPTKTYEYNYQISQ